MPKKQKKNQPQLISSKTGAGDEVRTRDINLGKVALYQLSYSRIEENAYSTHTNKIVKIISSLFQKHRSK